MCTCKNIVVILARKITFGLLVFLKITYSQFLREGLTNLWLKTCLKYIVHEVNDVIQVINGQL